MAYREAHVVPSPRGGWEVVEPEKKQTSHHATQRDAIRAAKELLRRRGGGEAVIHGRDGRIHESDTVGGQARPRRRDRATA